MTRCSWRRATSSLLAFDITKAKAPRELWHTNLGRDCRCVIAVGAAAYVGTDSGVVVYDLPTGDRTRQYVGGTGQVVTALTADSTRLFAATADGVTVFDLTSPDPVKYIPMAGEPTGLARRDSRLFVSLRDWGVQVLNILPGDSFVLDTLRLGRRCRAEGVTVSPGGYCIISQGDSGIDMYYSPTPDTTQIEGGGGGGGTSAFASAATEEPKLVTFYEAESSKVEILPTRQSVRGLFRGRGLRLVHRLHAAHLPRRQRLCLHGFGQRWHLHHP